MIRKSTPLSMCEAMEYVQGEGSEAVKGFAKKFAKLSPKEAKEMRKKLEAFDFMKLREEHVVKIIDLMPEDEDDLNKICIGASLDEDETKKILGTVKEFK